MLSAISFGVFCRSAPSTSLIMRSRKVEPGAAVIRTRIQSDSTCVPPVTAERSPPDSRMTGADSPVIAASLTEATPSITSPSEGMVSPGSTSTTSPTLRLVPGTSLWLLKSGPASSFAWVSVRCRRKESACALPRPSAMASAKLANSTVNQSQKMIWNVKQQILSAGHQVAQEDDRRQRGNDFDHEHDGVLDQRARIELDEGRADGRPHDLRVEQGRGRHALADVERFPWRRLRINSGGTGCRHASRDARRWVRARAPGRR